MNTEEAAQALQAHPGIPEAAEEAVAVRTAAADRRDHHIEGDSEWGDISLNQK
jgi:hypothetical protein